jgi:hypothetical protein
MSRPFSVGHGIIVGADGVARVGGRRATPTDVPLRRDLPEGHPLRDTRAVPVVLSGMTDQIIGEDGRLIPIDRNGNPIETDPEDILEVEI